MKKLLRKISMVACSLVLSITMVAATSSSSLALNSAGWSPWIVKSKSSAGKYYGDWKTGVKGKGGKGVKISLTKGYTVSNTLTGNIKLSHSKLDLALGYSTTETVNRTTSYSISAPKKNKTYTIKYRNVYNRTKLNQQRYFMVNDKFMDTQNAIAYGNKFSHFEYKWSVN